MESKAQISKPVKAPFMCDLCARTFVHRTHFDYHMKAHQGDKRYKCPECPKSFIVNATLKRHMSKHTDGKPFVCGQCSKRYKVKKSLTTHELVHGVRPCCRCDECPATFRSDTQLLRHKRETHGQKPFLCEDCGKAFGRKCILKAHMRTHQRDDLKYKCRHCPKEYPTFRELMMHRRAVEIAEGNRYKCKSCGAMFDGKKICTDHVKICGVEIIRREAIPAAAGAMPEADDDPMDDVPMQGDHGNIMDQVPIQAGDENEVTGAVAQGRQADREPLAEDIIFLCDQCGRQFSNLKHYWAHTATHLA